MDSDRQTNTSSCLHYWWEFGDSLRLMSPSIIFSSMNTSFHWLSSQPIKLIHTSLTIQWNRMGHHAETLTPLWPTCDAVEDGNHRILIIIDSRVFLFWSNFRYWRIVEGHFVSQIITEIYVCVCECVIKNVYNHLITSMCEAEMSVNSHNSVSDNST